MGKRLRKELIDYFASQVVILDRFKHRQYTILQETNWLLLGFYRLVGDKSLKVLQTELSREQILEVGFQISSLTLQTLHQPHDVIRQCHKVVK